MEIIPAIDIMKGEVVRLVQGQPTQLKVYYRYDKFQETLDQFYRYADRLHIIDLDAALGKGSNLQLIAKIVSESPLPIQIGGGLRNLSKIKSLLDQGVSRVIIGSIAFLHPEIVESLLETYESSRIVIAVDYLKDEIYINGWKTKLSLKIDEGIDKFLESGFKQFLVTSIENDGALTGTNLQTIKILSESYNECSLIAAGGISTLEELRSLKQIGVDGVVIGKALYEGVLTLREIKAKL